MRSRPIPVITLAAVALLAGGLPVLSQDEPDGPVQATSLLDLSGLAPLGPGLALGVHDAKHPDEDDRPRVSVLWLSDSPSGVTWQAADLVLPDGVELPNDLESASRIPDSPLVLVAESGDDSSEYQRLFLLDVDVEAEGGPVATVTAVTEWPEPVHNVEGMAVAKVGDDYALLYAERAQGDPTTAIQLAPLTLDPFEIGEPKGVDFTSPAVFSENDRPVSAMELAAEQIIHVASAFDTGDDDGPFSASVWAIGAVVEGRNGPRVDLLPDPSIVAFNDGYKTESLAVLLTADGTPTMFIGTDDEDFGGTMRPLPTE